MKCIASPPGARAPTPHGGSARGWMRPSHHDPNRSAHFRVRRDRMARRLARGVSGEGPCVEAQTDRVCDAVRTQIQPTSRRWRCRSRSLRKGCSFGGSRLRRTTWYFVKGLVEASDGLAALFSERGGELSVVAPLGREAELNGSLRIVAELGAEIDRTHASGYAHAGERGRAEEWPS